MKQQNPRRNMQHLSIQQVGAETLVYDELRHKAFCLNELSSTLWRLADGEHTVLQMSEAATLQLRSPIGEDIAQFALDEFLKDGLIEPFATDVERSVSRRTMLRRIAVGGAMLLPVVAAIVTPTAAQAYNGCFDCSVSPAQGSQARARQLAAARNQQLAMPGIVNPAPLPATMPGIGQPINIDPKLMQ